MSYLVAVVCHVLSLGARYSMVVACQMQLRDVKPTYIHRQFTF